MAVEERKGGARGDLEESSVGGDRTCPLYWRRWCNSKSGRAAARSDGRGRVGMSATRSTARGRAMQVVPP